MYPHERSLVEKTKNKPFALIGIDSDWDLERLRKRVKEENITWRSFWNGQKGTNGPIAKSWNVVAWPTIYVLDQKGVIRAKNVRREALERAVDKLLPQVKKAGARR
jgi:hypothetical protein